MENKHLLIAVVGRHASLSGWAALLREEGLPFKTYTSVECVDETPDITIFLNDSGIGPKEWTNVPAIFDRQYPSGAEVYTMAWAEHVYYGESDIIVPFRGWAIKWDGLSLGRFTLASEGESPFFPVACFHEEHTFLVGDISDMLNSRGFCYSPVCVGSAEEIYQLHPPSQRERVHRFLRDILLLSMERAGLPPARLSPFPPGHPLPFIFRVDVDYIVDPVMAPIRKWASLLNWKITAFVNISGEEKIEEIEPRYCQPLENLKWLSDFQNEGHEVACHGFFHSLWPDYKKILDDLVKAKTMLEDIVKRQIVGHASPGGLWHPNAGRAARSAGFIYTTEASLSWGGNPFMPITGNFQDYPIQIPCSPLYPACHECGENGESYFLGLFKAFSCEAVKYGEPLSFMGHPFDLEDASPSLWENIGAIVAESGFRPVTMAQMSVMAQQKAEINLKIFKANGIWSACADKKWELIIRDRSVLLDKTPKHLNLNPA